MNVAYNFCDTESEIIEKINKLDKVASSYLMENQDLFQDLYKNSYMEIFYFMSVIDKSIKLIESFLFALEKRNITVLAILARVQLDCVLRTYASTLVSDSNAFCKSVLIYDKRINNMKDMNNKILTDKYLCETLGEYLNLPIYDFTKKYQDSYIFLLVVSTILQNAVMRVNFRYL